MRFVVAFSAAIFLHAAFHCSAFATPTTGCASELPDSARMQESSASSDADDNAPVPGWTELESETDGLAEPTRFNTPPKVRCVRNSCLLEDGPSRRSLPSGFLLDRTLQSDNVRLQV